MTRLALAAAVLAAAACGPSSPSGLTLDGEWTGRLISVPRGPHSLTVWIRQSGTTLTGLGVSLVPGANDAPVQVTTTISGTVDGPHVRFDVVIDDPNWYGGSRHAGTFAGNWVSQDRVVGTYTTSATQAFASSLTRLP